MRFWILSIFVVLFCQGLCRDTSPLTKLARPLFRKFVRANNDFAGAFLTGARALTGDDNVFVSPFSVMTGLGMLSVAARGRTKEEILEVMQVDDWGNKHIADGLLYLSETGRAANETNYTLATANRVWSERSMRICSTFERRMRKFYDSELDTLDLKREPEMSREVVNEWVREQTGGYIKNLLPSGSVSSTTRLVLTNAIYFHGMWESPFDPMETSPMKFHSCLGGKRSTSPEVPTMYKRTQFAFKDSKTYQVEVVEIPYAGNDISMFLLLPHNGGCSRLKKLEKELSATAIADLTSGLELKDIKLFLPQFEVNYNTPLSKVLQRMGMKQAFNMTNADLSGIDCAKHSGDTCVSGAFHQAHVVVNEMGTTASASTGFNVGGRIPPHTMKFDKPFLFLIINKYTNAVFFIGRVVRL